MALILENLPEDIIRTIRDKIFNVPHDDRLTAWNIRIVKQAAPCLFQFRTLNRAFLGRIRVLDLHADDDPRINWKMILSLFNNYNDSLEKITLQDFRANRHFHLYFSSLPQISSKLIPLPQLRFLSIQNCDPDPTQFILESIEGKKLLSLHLDMVCVQKSRSTRAARNFFGKRFFSFLGKKCTSLDHLETYGMLFKRDIMKRSAQMVLRTIKSLVLSDVKFPTRGALTQFMKMFANHCKQLSYLKLNLFGVKKKVLIDLCTSNRASLKTISLVTINCLFRSQIYDPIDDDDAKYIINNCHNLTSLEFGGIITTDCFREKRINANDALRTTLTPAWVVHAANHFGNQIRHIGMPYVKMTGRELQAISDHCTSLESISFFSCYIAEMPNDILESFCSRIATNLVSLDIRCLTSVNYIECHFSPGGRFWEKITRSAKPTLKHLQISNFASFFTDRVLRIILTRLSPNLETLELYGSLTTRHLNLNVFDYIKSFCYGSNITTVILRGDRFFLGDMFFPEMYYGFRSRLPEVTLRMIRQR